MRIVDRKTEIILGIVNLSVVLFIALIAFITADSFAFGLLMVSMVGGIPLACSIFVFIGTRRFLDFRTARIETVSYNGVVHAKDKGSYYETQNDQSRYLVRVKTKDGFFDSHSKDAYLTYKVGDKVLISVTNRYNKKGKIFMQNTYIIGFSIV